MKTKPICLLVTLTIALGCQETRERQETSRINVIEMEINEGTNMLQPCHLMAKR